MALLDRVGSLYIFGTLGDLDIWPILLSFVKKIFALWADVMLKEGPDSSWLQVKPAMLDTTTLGKLACGHSSC